MMEKGKFLMFVTISGSCREKEREEITSLWKGSLSNANYDIQTFIMDQTLPSVCCVMGAMPTDIKDFLVSQSRGADVTLEGQVSSA